MKVLGSKFLGGLGALVMVGGGAFGFSGVGQAQERVFTSADGSQQFTGEVLELSADMVKVRRDDGSEFVFSEEILSERDQVWLAALRVVLNDPFEAPRKAVDEGEAVAGQDAVEGGESIEQAVRDAEGEAKEGAKAEAAGPEREGAEKESEAQVAPMSYDPLLGISPTARALLTSYANGEGPDLPQRRSGSGVQLYYDSPAWGYDSWYSRPYYGGYHGGYYGGGHGGYHGGGHYKGHHSHGGGVYGRPARRSSGVQWRIERSF